MNYQLVSTAICPFVQRAVIMLNEKGVAYEAVYVDLDEPPDWFVELSPRRRVPVLVADGTPIFESIAICEFLEEVEPEPPLFPRDPLLRARDRGWFGFVSNDLFPAAYHIQYGTDREDIERSLRDFDETLPRLEREMADREYLSGDGSRLGMADVVILPFLFRLEKWRQRGWLDALADYPGLRAWSARLLGRESVRDSVPENFDALDLDHMRRNGAFFARR